MPPVASVIWAISPGSSDVDWCEPNYVVSNYIAEFWNTVSNILFFVIPPILIWLFRPYAEHVKSGINVVWLLLVVVGLGSVYFHATLSLVGQLLDEIAIIWVVLAAMCIWYPKHHFPAFCGQNRSNWQKCIIAVAVTSSCLACVWPAINPVALFVFGVPGSYLLIVELIKRPSARCYELGVRSGVTWVVALASWAGDALLCDVWSALGFPYWHCAWHVCVFLASYSACVLFAYLDALREVPELEPRLLYWPYEDRGWWGHLFSIPYIGLNTQANSNTNGNTKPITESYSNGGGGVHADSNSNTYKQQ